MEFLGGIKVMFSVEVMFGCSCSCNILVLPDEVSVVSEISERSSKTEHRMRGPNR